MKSVRERMDILSAYREVGTYRGAAEICGTTHKTVKRMVWVCQAGLAPPCSPDLAPPVWSLAGRWRAKTDACVARRGPSTVGGGWWVPGFGSLSRSSGG